MLLRGTHIYQLDHTHVFYFGLDENHDAEEFRMGMCGSGVGREQRRGGVGKTLPVLCSSLEVKPAH